MTYRQMDIGDCRVSFATENIKGRVKKQGYLNPECIKKSWTFRMLFDCNVL